MGGCPTTVSAAKLLSIVSTAANLAIGGITPWRSQAMSIGPKVGWLYIQARQRFELLPNAHAATRRNGTVGKIGRMAPAPASATASHPSANQNGRVALLASRVSVIRSSWRSLKRPHLCQRARYNLRVPCVLCQARGQRRGRHRESR